MTIIDPSGRITAPDAVRRAEDAVRVFVSYSHKDPAYLRDDSLLGFLKGLGEDGGVEFWTDERITASSLWNDEIRRGLETSDIALVLVSQAFLDSPYCTQIEIESFLDSCRKRGLLIFPVVLSPCEWERHEWLATRQFLPGGSETIEEHYTEPGKQKRLFLRIRKELRQAVESVRAARAAAATLVPVSAPSSYAERRQVTFLHCDLLAREPDGTALDPDDASEVLHELMPEFEKASRELFAKYDGYVVGGGSVGTLVCFGYPEVAEDDSRRAVRAGLELVTRIAALSPRFEAELGVALATRVAIHTGSVVTTAEQANNNLSGGEAPITTLMLRQEAAPGTVLISSSTLPLVEPFFELEPGGSIRLPGQAPLAYSRVVADKGFETRFEAAASRTLTPIVGREKEVEFLLDLWQHARKGRGGVVMLSAEAGVGKSRLLKQVRTSVSAQPHAWIEWRSSPYYRDTALHGVIEALEDSLGITRESAGQEKLDRLAGALAALGPASEDLLPIIAPILSVQTAAPPAGSPQAQKELMLEALAAYVELIATKTPVVLVVEDLHWVDPTTVELLDLLIEQAHALPLLVLLTYRPEYVAPPRWISHPGVSQLALNKLDRAGVEQMVSHLTGGKALPPAVAEEIFAKTDGFPLFVEDLTRMVIESDLLRERDGAYELIGPFQSLSIPATLYETIMARLARLATAKPVAQLGATIGREFVYEMLRAVASLDDESLKRELDRLVTAGLLYRRGLLSKAKYIFKHALVQEALHESLLKRQRKQYHKLVAEVLEEKFPEAVRLEPELVARHCAEADLHEKAARYYLAAAQRAHATSANAEVLGHTANALTMLEREPDTEERARLELAVRCVQGSALVAMRGWAADECGECWRRARELCDRLPGSPQLNQVLKGLAVYYHTSARTIEACAIAEEMERKAKGENDVAFEMEALAALCCSNFWRGRYAESVRHGYTALETYDPAVHHIEHVSRFSEDPGALIYTFTAMSLACLGREEEARQMNELALAAVDVYSHLHSRCYLLAGAMFTNLQMREPERVMELSERLLAIARAQRFAGWIGIATPMQGWAIAALGEVERGIAQIKAGREGWRATGGRLHASQYPSLIAELYMSVGKFDEAEEWLRTGIVDAAQGSEGYHLSELPRLQGELAVLLGRPDPEPYFLRSLEIARAQSALTFELRTEVSYCELLRQRDPAAARERLAAVMARFPPGYDSWDMRRAGAAVR
ncbi:MAG TPA: AAA family ATPase [Thermoanaerobaculia bacterium]|nr:AAA family ATPase [Thermoanaerobaculia bacterium]